MFGGIRSRALTRPFEIRMRTQVPRFRLPEEVIDEEVGYILDLGVEFKGNSRIDSMRELLAKNYDAIFVGSGAPRALRFRPSMGWVQTR